MSDPAMTSERVQIINAIFNFSGVIIASVMAYFLERLRRQTVVALREQKKESRETANSVEGVRKSVNTSNKLAEKANRIHKAKVKSVAAKVDAVRKDLQESALTSNLRLDGLAKVAEATHTLVNNNMETQLLLNMDVSNRLAVVEGTEENKTAAKLAETRYKEYMAKQSKIDPLPGSNDDKKDKKELL